ncbi:hypothetical protein J8M20_04500 [Pseudoalteromonas luteoviolacea]|uniref:hypothetical protein n=1 Tax=Pseudoalteromonas luteoviolacea TaxID=43657 RepID=UPI001B39B502|nr:hypothetical protein [Pseudoalteromonas luteoviolacea]MBQ4810580.1 hypothetical protein [Pseudoalteromonas luteoviolacea]
MEARNWIGLGFIIVGVVLQPVGFMFVFWIQILSFILIFLGAAIFSTQKYLDHKMEKEYSSGHHNGQKLPGDIHDYSGWGEGGRSESWQSSDGGGGGE